MEIVALSSGILVAGIVVGVIMRSWWALAVPPVLVAVWFIGALVAGGSQGRSGNEEAAALTVILEVIPGVAGVLIGIIGRRALSH
jgi:hypothetical protein